MDNDVKMWSDFLKARFHPRTITSIDEYKHNDSNNVFNNFAQGLALWNSNKMKEIWTDNLRLYAEECDYLQVILYIYHYTYILDTNNISIIYFVLLFRVLN